MIRIFPGCLNDLDNIILFIVYVLVELAAKFEGIVIFTKFAATLVQLELMPLTEHVIEVEKYDWVFISLVFTI